SVPDGFNSLVVVGARPFLATGSPVREDSPKPYHRLDGPQSVRPCVERQRKALARDHPSTTLGECPNISRFDPRDPSRSRRQRTSGSDNAWTRNGTAYCASHSVSPGTERELGCGS